MSYNPNDPRYQSQYSNAAQRYPAAPAASDQYGTPPPPLNRVPSYDKDDEAAFAGNASGPRPAGAVGNYPPYGSVNAHGQQSNGMQMRRAETTAQLPPRPQYVTTGYPQQLAQPPQPQSPPATHPTYNPQQFPTAPPPPVQPTYNPQAYTNIGHRASVQQAYNPLTAMDGHRGSYSPSLYASTASYPSPSQSSYASASPPAPLAASAPQGSYFSAHSPPQGPLPTPPTQYQPYQPYRYGQPPGAQSASPHIPTSSNNYASAYTPPAPPPPPVPPEIDPQSAYEHRGSNSYSPLSLPQYPTPQSDTSPLQNSHSGPPEYDYRAQTQTVHGGQTSSIEQGSPNPPHQHQPQPQHQPQRANTTTHPEGRPLPGPPPESDTDDSSDSMRDEQRGSAELDAQEELYAGVEAAINNAGSGSQNSLPAHHLAHSHPASTNGGRSTSLPFRTDSYNRAQPNGAYVHGENGEVREHESDYENDPEAAAGAWALTHEDHDFFAAGYQPSPIPPHQANRPDPRESSGSEGEYVPYGADTFYPPPTSIVPNRVDSAARNGLHDWTIPPANASHPFPAYATPLPYAQVDIDGTGGLAEPGHVRHTSFDAEEDEQVELYRERSNSQSPTRDDYEYYYGSGVSPSDRPLPPPPLQTGSVYGSEYSLEHESQAGSLFPPRDSSVMAVPRSTSLNHHSSTPLPTDPKRAKTDADAKSNRHSRTGTRGIGMETIPGSAVTEPTIDLPSIPQGRRRRFNPAKLSTAEFKRCAEPWALSAIASWLNEMSDGETDLKEKTLVDGIVALFTHKVPTMNVADAETLAEKIVREMFEAGVLVHEEEWVKFGSATISGVLWQLTGRGCYAPRLHNEDFAGRCYAHHCSRTLKKINLQTQLLEPQRKKEDWATFYRLKKEDIEGVAKKEIERQNNLHEIVQGEDQFIDGLNVLRVLYRDALRANSIIPPNKVEKFLREVFGKIDIIKKVNEDYLLAQLKYRQQEQGPWLVGFSDIFREWIRKAKTAYSEFAAGFPRASYMMRQEANRNVLFNQFLDQARENERSRRLGWDSFLKSPITRLQHYTLLLSVVHKNMLQETEEKTNLQTAIDEIKVVTLECDTRVADEQRKIELIELEQKLKFRRGLEEVKLNLTHLGREIIFRGNLLRKGSNRLFSWVEVHAILFDHYMVIAKPVQQRDAAGGIKHEILDVSKQPISMDILVLEGEDDPPEPKSMSNRLGAMAAVGGRTQSATDTRGGKTVAGQSSAGGFGKALSSIQTNERPGPLQHASTDISIASTNSTASAKTMVTTTVIEGAGDESVIWPFRIKHLGKTESYTLYAPSKAIRDDWCDKIRLAKTKHAASLFAQNAEPFKLRILADTAFANDSNSGGPRVAPIRGTPLDRAIRAVENTFESADPRPGPVCRATVNCATTFDQPYGKHMVAVGTDYGIYVSETLNPRGWYKAITIKNVTQIAVLEEFSLFLVITNGVLIAYHLDVVCPVSGVPPPNDSARRAPQKLSGNRDVGFFSTGKMKDRTLVFYKKRETTSSVFKVLEPVFQKSTEKKSRFFRKGTTEFFREYDEFYIPAECYNINLFHSSLSVGTARGFEVLTLDKKVPMTLPDFKGPAVANIASQVASQKPLGMFRLKDEFLLCYEECAVYVSKHGEVSRGVVMHFLGKVKQAAMHDAYVLLVDSEFVEIRNASDGRLKQVVSGKDVRLLDDGSQGRTVKVVMQHPELEKTQIVVELVLNEARQDEART